MAIHFDLFQKTCLDVIRNPFFVVGFYPRIAPQHQKASGAIRPGRQRAQLYGVGHNLAVDIPDPEGITDEDDEAY